MVAPSKTLDLSIERITLSRKSFVTCKLRYLTLGPHFDYRFLSYLKIDPEVKTVVIQVKKSEKNYDERRVESYTNPEELKKCLFSEKGKTDIQRDIVKTIGKQYLEKQILNKVETAKK